MQGRVRGDGRGSRVGYIEIVEYHMHCVRFQYCPGHTNAMTCPYGGTALVRSPPLVVR